MYYKGNGAPVDYAQAREWYLKAAEQGSPNAQFALAEMCYQGEGGPVDKIQAKEWYSKSAQQGHDEAKERLKSLF
jgi:TPR repeat protein